MEIIIRPQINTILNEIFILRDKDSSRINISFINFDLNGNAIAKDVQREEELSAKFKPAMILPEKETRELLAAFAEAAKQRGAVKSDSYLTGKVEATEKHLEDMRRLVFENKEEIIIESPKKI